METLSAFKLNYSGKNSAQVSKNVQLIFKTLFVLKY